MRNKELARGGYKNRFEIDICQTQFLIELHDQAGLHQSVHLTVEAQQASSRSHPTLHQIQLTLLDLHEMCEAYAINRFIVFDSRVTYFVLLKVTYYKSR